MKTWQGSIVITVMALISSICGLGCSGCDDEVDPVKSGQYVLADGGLGVLDWLDGAQMSIDREAKTATIRYTRNGTTYDVAFTLTHL